MNLVEKILEIEKIQKLRDEQNNLKKYNSGNLMGGRL